MNLLVFLLWWFSRPLLATLAAILLGLCARAVTGFLPKEVAMHPKKET